jgi:GAF domain-containing protein
LKPACRSTIGAAAGYVALPTEDRLGEKLVFANLGEPAIRPDMTLFMPMVGLRQQAYATGKTTYTNESDSGGGAQWLPGGHLPLRNILFAPLTIKGFVVGTLGLANKSGGFSDDDARLAAAFAELAAIAVLNSQTIELLESSERRFRTLARATFEGIAISEKGIIREANDSTHTCTVTHCRRCLANRSPIFWRRRIMNGCGRPPPATRGISASIMPFEKMARCSCWK